MSGLRDKSFLLQLTQRIVAGRTFETRVLEDFSHGQSAVFGDREEDFNFAIGKSKVGKQSGDGAHGERPLVVCLTVINTCCTKWSNARGWKQHLHNARRNHAERATERRRS